MASLMGVINLTPDSFYEPSRATSQEALGRIIDMIRCGASIIDIGAVSTRPGARPVSVQEEWARLEPVIASISEALFRYKIGSDAGAALPGDVRFSIDTVRSETILKVHSFLDDFIVNDISAGEDDPLMLQTVGRLGLEYVAMHKRGNPQTMDSLTDYDGGIMPELIRYFTSFAAKAERWGIDRWILDPGLGFAKTDAQNWEILDRLDELHIFARPVLVGAADKRFTHGETSRAHALALERGASILRVHDLASIPTAVFPEQHLLSVTS